MKEKNNLAAVSRKGEPGGEGERKRERESICTKLKCFCLCVGRLASSSCIN